MKTQTLAALLLFCNAAFAQTPAPEAPIQETPVPTDALSPPATVPGPAPSRRGVAQPAPGPVEPYQLGSFRLYPEVVFTGMYDDNVYSTADNRIDDSALITSPALWLQSNWQRHFLSFHASADFTRYDELDAENSDDYRASGEGRYDFSPDANVYGGLRIAREHEDRESPEDRNGTGPTRYKAGRAYGGAFRQFGRVSLRAGVNVLKLDFYDTLFVSGSGATNIINNDDRDRTQLGAGVRAGYEIAPRLVAFAQVSADKRRYDTRVDDLGFARDSDGWRAVLGLRTFRPGTFKLEAFAGGMRQDYEDARLEDVSAPTVGANAVWNATRNTTLSVFLDRTIEETTVFQAGTPLQVASAYLNTYLQANANHRFSPVFSAYAFGSLSRADYQGITRVDDYASAGIGFVYRVAKSFFVDVTLQRRELSSEVPSEDFHRNQFFARLAFPLSR